MSTSQVILAVGTDHQLYIRPTIDIPWVAYPNSGNVVGIVVRPENGRTIAAGTDGNLYVHNADLKNATPWTGPVPNSGTVIAIALRPDHAHTLLGVGGNHLLYQWQEKEMNWCPLQTDGKVIGITVRPDNLVIGIGENYRLCYLSPDNKWIDGQDTTMMKSVAAMSDGSLVGVGMEGTLYTQQTLADPWVMVPNSGVVTSVAVVPAGVNIGSWRPPVGSDSDVEAGSVSFRNLGAFDCKFSVQWNGGEHMCATNVLSKLQSTTPWVSFRPTLAPEGASCWVRVYVWGGKTQDSSRNFTYRKNKLPGASYTVSGGAQTPSFD